MRAFSLRFVIGLGVALFALAQLTFSRSGVDSAGNEIAATAGAEQSSRHVNMALDVLVAPNDASAAEYDGSVAEQETFRQTAETRFGSMDLNLRQLMTKAKSGRAVTKEKLNEVIQQLRKKTKDARNELLEFRIAPPQQWEVRKTRLLDSLKALERDYEKAFAQFMNELALFQFENRTWYAA